MKQTADLKTYWNHNGRNELASNEVKKHIPNEGEAKTSELNLYRIMANVYYDLYNNGLCNWENYETDVKYYLTKFKDQIKGHTDKISSINTILSIHPDEEFYASEGIFNAFEDVMNAAVVIAYNSLKETASSNDSLEDRKLFYKGRGEHSVNQLETLVEKYKTFHDDLNNSYHKLTEDHCTLQLKVENIKAELKVLANQTGTPQRIAKAIYNIILK